jgi:hypothetical protein
MGGEIGRWQAGGWDNGKSGEGKSLVRVWTSEESDRLVTTRAVPATYEPKVRHSREYRRLQAADSYGKWEGGWEL